MIFLNCCIVNCDELDVQSCHAYFLLESWDVARQRVGLGFLYESRKTCTQCHVYWSLVCACFCEFWSLKNINTAVPHMLLFQGLNGRVDVPRSQAMCLRFQKTLIIWCFMHNRRAAVPPSQAVCIRFQTTWGYIWIHSVSLSLSLSLSFSLSPSLSISLSLSLCTYTYIYIYIFIYTYRCIYNNVNMQVNIHISYLDAAAKHWFVRWRVRSTYAIDNDNNQRKGRFMHGSLEWLHVEMRFVACPVVPLISLARERWCRDTACCSCFSICV
jgi:hypothetical protein